MTKIDGEALEEDDMILLSTDRPGPQNRKPGSVCSSMFSTSRSRKGLTDQVPSKLMCIA